VTAAVVVVGGAGAALVVVPALEHRGAEQRYEAAGAARQEARGEWDVERASWDEADARAQDAMTLAAAVTPAEALPYLDGAAVSAVEEVAGAVEAAYRQAPDVNIPEVDISDPETTDELNAAAEAFEAQTDAYARAATGYSEGHALLIDLTPDLTAAADDLLSSIPEQAAALEAANISSTAQSRIRLHYAAEAAASSEDSVDYYVAAYAEAAEGVEQSQRDEMEEKDQGDGLIQTRLEIEEFVRSITGGVRVDFDWAPIVNGLGDGDSAGGRVTWQYLDGGSATMELSNSVAAHWPDTRYESLVAHESGHVITAKCQDLLVDTFDGDAELMATSWAIGMGYTDGWGNGVNFYSGGVAPAQDLVDATTACR
jgi:hypothetical protein